jgi:hypothetical protein
LNAIEKSDKTVFQKMHRHLQLSPQPGHRFAPSFEDLFERLAKFEGMFIEWDGSFVWRDRQHSPPKQMDGMIYDRDGSIVYIEVQGDFSLEQWMRLCRSMLGQGDHLIPSETEVEDLDRILMVHETQTGRAASVQDVVNSIAI